MNYSSHDSRTPAPLDSPELLLGALREQEMSPPEARQLAPVLLRLAEWQAPDPGPAATRQLAGRLLAYLPRQSAVRQALLEQRRRPPARLAGLLYIARQQIGILRPSFWLLSLLVVSLGTLAILFSDQENDQVLLLRLVGPLLAYLGATAAFRGIGQAVLEFELACPPSPLQLTLARLVVVLGYDTGLGLLISAGLAAGSGESFLAVTLHWLMPLLLVMGLALLLTLRLPPLAAATIAYGGWVGLLASAALAEKYGLPSINLTLAGEVTLGLAGLALLWLALLNIRRALPVHLPRN